MFKFLIRSIRLFWNSLRSHTHFFFQFQTHASCSSINSSIFFCIILHSKVRYMHQMKPFRRAKCKLPEARLENGWWLSTQNNVHIFRCLVETIVKTMLFESKQTKIKLPYSMVLQTSCSYWPTSEYRNFDQTIFLPKFNYHIIIKFFL